MGESDVSLDSAAPISAALMSAAVVFPIVFVIAGCAICRRLCPENEDEESRPLLSGERGERQTRIERVENEPTQHRRKEPERYSPQSHSDVTREQPEPSEERIEETRQQEAQPVVVAEAALIPDLLRIDEQEQEKSHQTEPDILEPRPFPYSTQSPQLEHKEVTVLTEGAQQELPKPQLEGQLIPNSQVVQKQLSTTDKGAEHLGESKEINVKSEALTLPTEAEGQLIPNLEDVHDQPITRDKETEQEEESKVDNSESQAPTLRTEADQEHLQSLMQDQEQFLKTMTDEDNDTIQIETESETAIFQTVKGDEVEPAVNQKLDESSPNKALQNETPQDTQEPLLPRTQDDSLSAELQDPQTDVLATALQTEQQLQDLPPVLSPSVELAPDNSTADKEVKEDAVVEEIIQDDPAAVVMDQSQQGKDIEATAALEKKEESQKAEERIEEQTKQPQEEQSPSTQHPSEEVKETPDETVTEAGESVKEQSGQVTEPGSKVILDFDVTPSFVKTIRTKAAKKESKAIFGLTILNGELFIINEHGSDVEVYDSESLAFKHQFHLEGLFDPVDIKSSSKHYCIYIFDWEGESNEILRVASDGKLITKWKTGDDGGYISVTLEANVILSVWDKSLLKEFTADGQLLREIQLSASITELRLAVKLPNGDFIISQGEDAESEHRVCLVDDKGIVVKSIGGKKGSSNGEFDSPNYMVVDGSGFILVADQNNRRVVLLSPDLKFKKEIIQERDDLRYPVRMDLDRTSGRLFVADNDYLEDHTGWRDGRVMAFDFTIHH